MASRKKSESAGTPSQEEAATDFLRQALAESRKRREELDEARKRREAAVQRSDKAMSDLRERMTPTGEEEEEEAERQKP